MIARNVLDEESAQIGKRQRAAIGSDDVSAQICFGKMGDAGRAVNFKRDQPHPCLATEGIEIEGRWNKWPDQIGRIGPMQEREVPPRLAHDKAWNRLRRRSCDGLHFI